MNTSAYLKAVPTGEEASTPKRFGNLHYKENLKAEMTATFDALDAILVDHAGPFATNCAIGSRWRQRNDVDEFTKDGIKILSHVLVSEDAIERFATRLTRFVGIAIDKRCHDGTTTAMLLFCRIAKAAIRNLDTSVMDKTRYVWLLKITETLDRCAEHLKSIRITEDDIYQRATALGIKTTPEDIRGAMAYHMAMISSKGDHDLSFKISEVIRSCPKNIYGMFRDSPAAVETEERYILKKQDYDLLINCNPFSADCYNYKNNTQFLSEDAVIFSTPNHIVTHSWESIFLNAFISKSANRRADLGQFGTEQGWEQFHHNKRNLIILCHEFNDPSLMETVMLFNKEHPQCPITIFTTQVAQRMRTSLDSTIHYLAKAYTFKDVMHENALDSLIGLDEGGVRFHLIGFMGSISGLYKRDGEVFHPFYRDPNKFPDYTRFREETEDMIDFANQNIANPALPQDEVTYLTSLYRALTTQEIYDIQVGGSVHEQYANRTVYEDAIGAALAAVNEGVVFNGYGHLVNYLYHELPDDEGAQLVQDAMVSIMADAMRCEDRHFIEELCVHDLTDKWTYLVADKSCYPTAQEPVDYIETDTLDATALDYFLRREEGPPILIQAWSGYDEQFRRYGDMIPMIINTTHLADIRTKPDDDVA